MIKQGDLVKHVSDDYCNKFGLGIVTAVIKSGTSRMKIAHVVWQHHPGDLVYPPDLFTFDGLVLVSKAPKNTP